MTTTDEAVQLASGPAWANRYALAPMINKQSHDDGTLSDAEYDWLVVRGRGGFGVVKTCAAYVPTPAGRGPVSDRSVAAVSGSSGPVG